MIKVQGTNKSLTRDEVKTVLADLEKRGRRSVNTRMNNIIFRLAHHAGLRASEIASLRVMDVKLNGERPLVHVHKGKGNKSGSVQVVSLTTTAALATHLQLRKTEGASGKDMLLVKTNGKSFDRNEIAKRYKSAIRCLPEDRRSMISVHWGRHTAATRLLDNNATIATVKEFLRHTNIQTTSVYLHGQNIVAIEDFD